MQKLQLRIAEERKISVNSLKGDEFKILKEYKKLEERRVLMNNVDDFFDEKYNQQPLSDHSRSNMKASGFDNESRQMMSEHGEHIFYSNDSKGHDSAKLLKMN